MLQRVSVTALLVTLGATVTSSFHLPQRSPFSSTTTVTTKKSKFAIEHHVFSKTYTCFPVPLHHQSLKLAKDHDDTILMRDDEESTNQNYAQTNIVSENEGATLQCTKTNTTQSTSMSFPFHVADYNVTLMLPSYTELMQLNYGQCYTSEKFTVQTNKGNEYDFCIKFYPRGGGHLGLGTSRDQQQQQWPFFSRKSGFGMSYQVVPLWARPTEKVGVYLQFLPRHIDDSVDVSFALRLKGGQQQPQGRKFDLEWRAGMRFVALDRTKLAEGRANDFGAHLLQTPLLPSFLGLQEEEDYQKSVQLNVQITIHDTKAAYQHAMRATNEEKHSTKQSLVNDLRHQKNPEDVRVGKIIVPVLNRLSQRPRMFQQGLYPGVEYRILRILDAESKKDLWYRQPGVLYDVKPIYPLVQQLERSWPVRIHDDDIPKLLSQNMYNVVSAVGSLLTAVTGLLVAWTISQAISLYVIPSLSMTPTLQKGDVLLVEKVSPRLPWALPKSGDVIFFRPPNALQQLVAQTGGRLADRDLFVKRVAAVPGDTLSVKKDGSVTINNQEPPSRRDLCQAEPLRLIEKYISARDNVLIQPSEVVVLGDCSSVSIDSRVWGPLSNDNIVGRPILRIWPFSRIGLIPPLP